LELKKKLEGGVEQRRSANLLSTRARARKSTHGTTIHSSENSRGNTDRSSPTLSRARWRTRGRRALHSVVVVVADIFIFAYVSAFFFADSSPASLQPEPRDDQFRVFIWSGDSWKRRRSPSAPAYCPSCSAPLSSSPAASDVHSVKLSLNNCIMRVLSLYDSSFKVSNSAIASSNADLARWQA